MGVPPLPHHDAQTRSIATCKGKRIPSSYRTADTGMVAAARDMDNSTLTYSRTPVRNLPITRSYLSTHFPPISDARYIMDRLPD